MVFFALFLDQICIFLARFLTHHVITTPEDLYSTFLAHVLKLQCYSFPAFSVLNWQCSLSINASDCPRLDIPGEAGQAKVEKWGYNHGVCGRRGIRRFFGALVVPWYLFLFLLLSLISCTPAVVAVAVADRDIAITKMGAAGGHADRRSRGLNNGAAARD